MSETKAKRDRNAYMREYMKEYREKNRERINAQRREWARNNPDRVKAHQEKYWDRKIKEKELTQ